MQFTMRTPCDGCPFLRTAGAVRIDKARAKDIAEMMCDPSGGTFPCHKTTCFGDNGEHVPHSAEMHCAGALIFSEKNGNATQMMRIAERIGSYDAKSLMTDNAAVADVFDTVDEMVEANHDRRIPRKRVRETNAIFGRRRKAARKS